MEENSLLTNYDAENDWVRARRRVIIQKVLCALKGCSFDLLSFEEVQSRLHLSQRTYRGIQTIELEKIRGSVGRYRDFTSAFLPRKKYLHERWKRINRVVANGGGPPIEVYQVGEAYFVLDGNHRVSAARQQGMKSIEAHVCEYAAPVGLSADADVNELLIKAEYVDFLSHTHLDKVRPGQKIVFTTPGRYRVLECQIEIYRQILERNSKKPITYEDAVFLWYDRLYSPSIKIIQENGVMKQFPNRTEADLFIWLWQNKQDLQATGIEDFARASGKRAEATPKLVKRLLQAVTRMLRIGANKS